MQQVEHLPCALGRLICWDLGLTPGTPLRSLIPKCRAKNKALRTQVWPPNKHTPHSRQHHHPSLTRKGGKWKTETRYQVLFFFICGGWEGESGRLQCKAMPYPLYSLWPQPLVCFHLIFVILGPWDHTQQCSGLFLALCSGVTLDSGNHMWHHKLTSVSGMQCHETQCLGTCIISLASGDNNL